MFQAPLLYFHLLGTSLLALDVASVGSGQVAAPARPTHILDGFEVPACAWPSVVFLRTSSELCTGVYIGGKIVLTAAHCMDDDYQIEALCDVDADCPDEDFFGEPLDLTCVPPSTCAHPDELRSNDIATAVFGEEYALAGDGHPRRSIPIKYCRKRQRGNNPSVSQDFAYCVLRDEPNVQPVPLMMHCEAEQFLTEDTEVWAVGFGDSEAIDVSTAGRKRFATSTLSSDVSAGAKSISLTGDWNVVGGVETSAPTFGDSGGPLFVRIPDGSFRVVGLAVTNFPAYVTVWQHIPWMLEDPEVAADIDEILPCHTPQGLWKPTAGCGQFPLAPDASHGDWARGPMACHDPDVSGPSETCGAAFQPLLDEGSALEGLATVAPASSGARGLGVALAMIVPIGFGLVGVGVWSLRRRARGV